MNIEFMDELQKRAESLVGLFKEIESREMYNAMEKLEESVMWATKAYFVKKSGESHEEVTKEA